MLLSRNPAHEHLPPPRALMTSASATSESHQPQRLNARHHTVNASCKQQQACRASHFVFAVRSERERASVLCEGFDHCPDFSTNENTALQDGPISRREKKRLFFFSAEHSSCFDATRHSVIPHFPLSAVILTASVVCSRTLEHAVQSFD